MSFLRKLFHRSGKPRALSGASSRSGNATRSQREHNRPGEIAPSSDFSIPLDRVLDLSGALFTYVLKPRGLPLAQEIDFYTAECEKCRKPVPAESIAKVGSVLSMQSLFAGANVIGGFPSGGPRCRHCGHDACSFTLQRVTAEEREAVRKAIVTVKR